MRIQFEIKENLPEIIEEILHSDKWQTSVKEELSGRTTVVIRDQAYGSEATIEIYATSIEIKTAWSKYSYRIFVANDIVWCEYPAAVPHGCGEKADPGGAPPRPFQRTAGAQYGVRVQVDAADQA